MLLQVYRFKGTKQAEKIGDERKGTAELEIKDLQFLDGLRDTSAQS